MEYCTWIPFFLDTKLPISLDTTGLSLKSMPLGSKTSDVIDHIRFLVLDSRLSDFACSARRINHANAGNQGCNPHPPIQPIDILISRERDVE